MIVKNIELANVTAPSKSSESPLTLAWLKSYFDLINRTGRVAVYHPSPLVYRHDSTTGKIVGVLPYVTD